MTKKQLIEYLDSKGFLESVDFNMIDLFWQNWQIAKKANAKVRKEGILVNVRQSDENPYWQQHPALAVYNAAVKNLMNLSRKLGLSAYDRMNLKIDLDNLETDGYDDD